MNVKCATLSTSSKQVTGCFKSYTLGHLTNQLSFARFVLFLVEFRRKIKRFFRFMVTNIAIMTITAYCHCSQCCGKPNQPTASGLRPRAGTTIAAPRALPFGTTIMIPSVGARKVQDRLARKYDNRIDIFMASHQAAKNFGIKRETVTIITK